MERVQWILNNWHLVSAVLAVAAFVIFDVYENRTGGKWSLPIKVYLGAILVLLATIMVSLAMQHRPHIDHLLQNGDRLTSLLSAMKEQNENGITVKVALKSKLDQQPKYKFKQGMVLLEYQNREPVLMEESNGYYETGYNGFPSAYTMRVTWGEARVREYEEFLGWLVSEGPSDTVCDFATTEGKEPLLRNSASPGQPNTRVGSLGRLF